MTVSRRLFGKLMAVGTVSSAAAVAAAPAANAGTARTLLGSQRFRATSSTRIRTISNGDAVQLPGCALTNGSTAATFTGASLKSGDVGKAVVAVNNPNWLVTKIASVTDATHATLAQPWGGATTTSAQITYGTDFTAQINSTAATLGTLKGGKIVVASPVLCLGSLILPNGVALTALGFTLGGAIYAGHYGNIIQSSLWGKTGTPQNQFCDAESLTLIGLLPVTPLKLGQTDSTGKDQYLFTTIHLPGGALSEKFTNGKPFPVSASLDSRWPAGSSSAPVHFWHNNILFNYTSATPFATCNISDPAHTSATVLSHGYVYPLDSQGHGVAFQSFRGAISTIRTFNTLGSGVRLQGSGTADPTAYGHNLNWIRAESPGWACVDFGEATTDDFATILNGTAPGLAGVIVMGGDPTISKVHIIGDARRPWVPHVVSCPTNGSYSEIILDKAYGPGFVLDAGQQFRARGPSETLLNGLRYLGEGDKPGQGIPILIKTRNSGMHVQELGISGVTFSQTCAFLIAHAPQTQVASTASVTVSTSPVTLPVLDASAFDPLGGMVSTTHAGSTQSATYQGVTINATSTSGNQKFTIGSGGSISLYKPLLTRPAAGDWYIVGGEMAVQVSSSDKGGKNLVFSSSASLYGKTGSVTIATSSPVSLQVLTGVALASGSQTLSTGDHVVQVEMQQGNVQGSIDVPGAVGMALPFSQSPISVKSTDSLLLSDQSQLGTGLGVTTAGPLYGTGTVTVAKGATTGQAPHGLAVRANNTPVVTVTPTSLSGLPSGSNFAASADHTNLTVTLSAAATALVTFNYNIRVAP